MNYQGMKYLLAALLFGACTESDLLLREQEAFAVQFSTAGISAEVTTRSSSPLGDDVTLRILAFRRVGSTPDLSTDEYMGDGMYKAGNSDGTLTAVTPLLLRAGTYDFYALTPGELTVTYPDNSGSGRTCTVSVGHGMDYATSLTVQKTVSEASPAVPLNDLERHCTKLAFALSPKGSNITSVDIISAGLTNMTDAPVEGQLHEALPVEDATRTTSLALTGFMATDASKPLELSAFAVILPKKADAMDYQMKVKFNGSTKETELLASLPDDLAFQPGFSYTFTVKMKGGMADLVLTVRPWEDHSFTTDMGEADGLTLTVGTWTDVHWDSTNGGNADTGGGNSSLVISGWEPSHTWSDEMGRYPGLSMTSGGWENTSWGNYANTGGGNTQLKPGDWDSDHSTGNSNGGELGKE